MNAMDRTKASMLAAVFVSHLAETEFDRQQQQVASVSAQNDLDDSSLAATNIAAITAADANRIIVGYDTDRNSPNLFAGVVQAVRQVGSHVVDIGCCSAASLHYAIRHFKGAGGIIVTSASSRSGEIGFDVFDQQGQTVSVPWQKYGIRSRLHRRTDHENDALAGSKPEQFAQDLRRQLDDQDAAVSETHIATSEQMSELILPDTTVVAMISSGRRRHSGQLQAYSVEADYRKSVRRWWGQGIPSLPLRIFCRNEIVASRIEWLAAACSAVVELHEDLAPEEAIAAGGSNQPVTIEIEMDDRFFTVWSRTGRQIQISELMEWLNQRLSRNHRHVTAHAADPFRMIQLLDLAGPGSGAVHDTTVDAVAIVGLLLNLSEEGRHSLPV